MDEPRTRTFSEETEIRTKGQRYHNRGWEYDIMNHCVFVFYLWNFVFEFLCYFDKELVESNKEKDQLLMRLQVSK
jgi:hypothetical protein